MTKKTAKKLLKLNYDLYEHQAQCFSKTRSGGIWEQEILDFIEKIDLGSSVLDLGCGNGRLYDILKHSDVLKNVRMSYQGVDLSKEFIKICQKKYCNSSALAKINPRFEIGDGLTMKFKNQFDYIICISVFHHIPSKKLQMKFLTNCWKVLKPDGKILISVWNRWQPRFKKYFNIKKPFADMKCADTIVPWMHSKYKRYIHLFKPLELKTLVQKAGFKNIQCFPSRHGKKTTLSKALNIYLIGEK